MKKNILIIEDDIKISRYLELEFLSEGYNITTAHDGAEAWEKYLSSSFSLILLDLMLPKLSGEDLCKKIRSHSDIPIIVLTAKDEIFSKISLLDLGADDYLTKPFDIEELFARIRVVFRNKSDFTTKNILQFENLKLDTSSMEVFINDNKINLTKTEFNLLHYLMINKNLVLTRDNILESVWGYEYFGGTKIVDVYIKEIRKKLGDAGRLIKTIRGFGYSLKKEDS